MAMPVWSDGEDTVNKLVERGACVSVPKNSNADAIYQAEEDFFGLVDLCSGSIFKLFSPVLCDKTACSETYFPI